MNKYIYKNILFTTTLSLLLINTGITNAQNVEHVNAIKTSTILQNKKMYVNTYNTPIFNKPNGYLLNTIEKGTLVNVISTVSDNKNEFAIVKYRNQEGYIETKHLTDKKETVNNKYLSTNEENYYVFSKKSERSKKIMIIPGGSNIEVIETSGAYSKIKYSNKEGFIKYKNIVSNIEGKNMFIISPVVKTYSAPSKESDINGTLSFGESIEVTKFFDKKINDFVEVKMDNGATAFVEIKDISTNKPIEHKIQYADITKGECFDIYEQANPKSTKIGTILGGSKIVTNGIVGDYTSIIYNGVQSYIKTSDLASTPKNQEAFISDINVAVHKEANDQGNTLGTLKYGDTVQVYQHQPDPINKYVKIKYSHGNRIVNAYIDKNSLSKEKPKPVNIGYIDIKSCSETNLFINESINSKVINNINAGDEVIIISTNNDMTEVIYNGQKGFVLTKNITLEQTTISKYIKTSTADVFDTPQWLTNNIVGILKEGEHVDVIKNNVGPYKDFSLIKYKGNNCYIKTSSISN